MRKAVRSAARWRTTGSCRILIDSCPANTPRLTYQSGAYYLADVSTNGVYVNGEDEPLGKGNPRRLFNGDKLRMGDIEFQVSLDEGEGLAMPPPEPMTVVPDHVERLVPEEEAKTGVDLLGEEELTGDEEFQSALFGGTVTEKEPEKGNGKIDKHENPFAPPPTKSEVKRVDLENLLDAFMQGPRNQPCGYPSFNGSARSHGKCGQGAERVC